MENRDRLRRMIIRREQIRERTDEQQLLGRRPRRTVFRERDQGPRARFEFLFEDFIDPMMRDMMEREEDNVFMARAPRQNNYMDDSQIAAEDEREKLSPRNLVEPNTIIREQYTQQIDCFKIQKKSDELTDQNQQFQKSLKNRVEALQILSKDRDDQDNYFVCNICYKVLLNPVECSKCQTAFCKGCIGKWQRERQGNNKCPFKCADPQYADLHRYVKNELQQRRFFCPLPACPYSKDNQIQSIQLFNEKDCTMDDLEPEKISELKKLGLIYEQALIHMDQCQFKEHPCPLGCGQKIFERDLDEHKLTCINFEKTCEICEISYKPNQLKDGETHDCIKELIRKTQEQSQELNDLKRVQGINYEQVNCKCPLGHDMEIHRGKVYQYCTRDSQYSGQNKSPCCKICGEKDLDLHYLFYRCSDKFCNQKYDICRMCALSTCDPPIFKEKMKKSYYDHELTKKPANNVQKWVCGSKNLPAYLDKVPSGQCMSNAQFPPADSKQFVQGYECKTNGRNFNICVQCMLTLEE